ncbi:MAG: hypothetical protein JXB45_11710 [Candidatus Krumholzibacteriota bacterium]|nr:hypothetical protein [Candidatus Krumholzibacteriota bacterium]
MSIFSTRPGGSGPVKRYLIDSLRGALLVALLLMTAGGRTPAQTVVPFNQRDDTYPLLGLKRAREAFEYARSHLERQQEMFDKGLISFQELEQAQNLFADAEVNYQQSLLAVLFEKQFVSVREAVKYQAADGSKHVRIVLANTSGGSADFLKLVNVDEKLFRSLQPDIINDVYVSLLNDEGAIISQPYEVKVEQLRFGSPVELDFEILQDLDALTVDIVYGNGSRRTPKIFLQKDSSVDRVVVQSEQFSQEVELGGSASFDLNLELFSSTANTYKLEVAGLPRQITRYFVSGSGEARLSQLKFTERTNSVSAALRIFLPDRASGEVVIGEPIPFYVLAVPRDRNGILAGLEEGELSEDKIEALDVGFVKLEVVPRGQGKLLVKAPQLYHSIESDGRVEMSIVLVNEGTRRLDNVEVEIDAPFDWRKEADPRLIKSLEVSEERSVKLIFTPPVDIAVGRYEFRLRTSSLSDDQPIRGEDKTVTVEIKARTNLGGIFTLIALILLVVGGIVAFGVKLSRR